MGQKPPWAELEPVTRQTPKSSFPYQTRVKASGPFSLDRGPGKCENASQPGVDRTHGTVRPALTWFCRNKRLTRV